MNNMHSHNERMSASWSSSRQARRDRSCRQKVKQRKTAPAPAPFRIKLQLDHKTIITITKESSLVFWRQRYPNLTILS